MSSPRSRSPPPGQPWDQVCPPASRPDDLGSAFKTTLVTRGFTVSPVVGLPQGVSVFLDGVPVNEPDAGQVNFDLLPLEHVERIEFLSGTASLLGPNSMGGAVNLVTRRGDRSRRGHAEASAGSHGLLELDAAAGDARPPWRYYVGAGHRREDGWRVLTGARSSHQSPHPHRAARARSHHRRGEPDPKAQVYGMAEYVLGRATVSGGARLDAVRITFRNRLDPRRDTTSTYIHWSPRVGASLGLGRGLSVYASAGGSFRAPAVIELACADPNEPCPLPFALGDDPPLDAVTATSYEVGARWLLGRALMTGTLYRTRVANEIFLFPYEEEGEPAGSTIDGYFANIPRTRREGVEIGARLDLGDGHSA